MTEFYNKYNQYSSVLDRLCEYLDHAEELVEEVNATEQLDFDKQMDELEGLLDKNDELLGGIRESLKKDFMGQLDALD